jgi:hypothetical protein
MYYVMYIQHLIRGKIERITVEKGGINNFVDPSTLQRL